MQTRREKRSLFRASASELGEADRDRSSISSRSFSCRKETRSCESMYSEYMLIKYQLLKDAGFYYVYTSAFRTQ